MWFAKLFGVGRDDASDDEPARFPSVVAVRPPQPQSVSRAAGAKPVQVPGKKGFDPYNSGAFERKSAWERVNRR